MNSRLQRTRVWAILGGCAIAIIATPFLAGAIWMGLQLVRLPGTFGHFVMAQNLEATLFAFGFGLGTLGSGFALASKSASRRTLGAAATLFGCSHISLAFIIRHSIDESVLPPIFFIPVALWALSVWLAIRAPGLGDRQFQESLDNQPIQKQPQPLSQP